MLAASILCLVYMLSSARCLLAAASCSALHNMDTHLYISHFLYSMLWYFFSQRHSLTVLHCFICWLLLGFSVTKISGSSSGSLSSLWFSGFGLCWWPDSESISLWDPASRRSRVGTWPRMGLFCWRPEIHWLSVAWSPWLVIHMA